MTVHPYATMLQLHHAVNWSAWCNGSHVAGFASLPPASCTHGPGCTDARWGACLVPLTASSKSGLQAQHVQQHQQAKDKQQCHAVTTCIRTSSQLTKCCDMTHVEIVECSECSMWFPPTSICLLEKCHTLQLHMHCQLAPHVCPRLPPVAVPAMLPARVPARPSPA
jgi:hypothetical protein